MTSGTHGSQPLEVWMDGNCDLCRRSQAWCELRDPGDRIAFRDFRDSHDLDLPVNREAHEKSMWVRTGDGTLHQGFSAWRLVMQEIPGWRWLARVAGVPPFSWFGSAIYPIVARYRQHLS